MKEKKGEKEEKEKLFLRGYEIECAIWDFVKRETGYSRY